MIHSFIKLQIILAPEVASRPPIAYILGICYIIAECYTLIVLSSLLWINLGDSIFKGLTVAGIIFASIEKARVYADVLEPFPFSVSYIDDQDFMRIHENTEYLQAYDQTE